MKRILLLTSLLIILCMLVSSCSRNVRNAIQIPISDDSYEITDIDVAVDYFGVKHIVTRVCSIPAPTDCQIVYWIARTGVPTVVYAWYSPAGYIGVENPSIAVTDSGVAAIAWQTAHSIGGAYATLYVLSTAVGTVNEIDPPYIATEQRLVSKGNVIYAVQDIKEGGRFSIRYRQLVGGSSGGWVSEHGGSKTSDDVLMDASVSPSGNLYVVWWRSPSGDIMYADNYGDSGDMTNRFGLISGAFDYTMPRIDVNGSPEVVYISYTHQFLATSDLLVIAHCSASSCAYPLDIELPLDTSKQWNIIGEADVIADAGTTAYYVFNATNTDTPGNREVYEGYFQDGLAYYTANASNTAENDGVPSIGLMWSIIPVSSWVTGDDIYQFDAYPFILPYASLRLIHHTGATIFTDSTNMSCNADWGAGVWIEDQGNNQGYVIFNAYQAMPIAVSRGGNVYVTYEVQSTTYSQIRYKMLNSLGVGGWVDTCFSTAECILHDAVVGWNGYLYVSYAQADYLEYADNYGVTGDMTNHVYVSTYFSSISDIDVNGNPEMVYLIYDDTREFPGFSNGLFVNYCPANSCTSMTIAVIPLADSELWRLQGNPQVISDTVTTAYYIFTATHVASPNINVYTGIFQVGVTPAPPTQMTDTPGTEADVRICLMWSVFPVTGWRMDLGGGFFGDIFEDAIPGGRRKVRETTTGAVEMDMACNADWGAGIWNEETGIGIQALVSFNTIPVFVPMIKK